jgi:hypothetical protein
MPGYPYIAVELTLVESGGPHHRAGRPSMLCRFKAAFLPGTNINDGQVCVVVPDQAARSWKEYAQPVTFEQAREVVRRLDALGIPGRTPEVQGVVDTSNGWTHLLFCARGEQHTTTLDIDMESSGFEGEDAERLRALFRQLFALAGYGGFCPAVYGSHQHGSP